MSKMRQWSILTAVAVLVVFVAGWFLLISPQRSHAASLRTTAAGVQQSNAELLSKIQALAAAQKDQPAEQERLERDAIKVPSTEQEPTIIRDLVAAANGADVDMVTITPGTPTEVSSTPTTTGTTPGSATLPSSTASTSTLVELPISLGITGTYPTVESFFNAIERLPRSMMIIGWSLCPEQTAATASSNASSGSCSAPTAPSNKTLPANALGANISAVVYYSPPGSTAPATTLPATTTTTAPTTGTTPAATASTPAATTPTTSTTPTAAASAPVS